MNYRAYCEWAYSRLYYSCTQSMRTTRQMVQRLFLIEPIAGHQYPSVRICMVSDKAYEIGAWFADINDPWPELARALRELLLAQPCTCQPCLRHEGFGSGPQ